MYQEVNNLRIIRDGLNEEPLSLEQRDLIMDLLESKSDATFTAMKKALKIGGDAQFNLKDPKRQGLKGNETSAILSKPKYFGKDWLNWTLERQDEVVHQLVNEQSEATLIKWLQEYTGVSEDTARNIANAKMPSGYGSLSRKALAKILPALRKDVITYDKAVIAAGYQHHSAISHAQTTGEILPALPYYGEPLQRHVGFGTGKLEDQPEKRFGKIANPTVHIGLNQIRVVVNALIKKYGHPSEVIIEVARDLKQSREQRKKENKRQAENQKRNERIRQDISNAYQSQGINLSPGNVKQEDVMKWKLWEELNLKDPSNRCCPYSGVPISAAMLLSDQVEVEHILPFSRTLDDSMNNKTVATRMANRIKGNRTPWEAFGQQNIEGYDFADIQERAKLMDVKKRYRFAKDGYEKWLKEDKDFLTRALNDTRYLSRIAKEYLSLICPQNTRVIPGQMTAMLRGKFGLDDILAKEAGLKNRDDHRHHAVDACVIGITDQAMLQRFAYRQQNLRLQPHIVVES